MATENEEKSRWYNRLLSADGRIFLSCLVLAGVLWLLLSLNERYSTVIPVNIYYQNKPQGQVYVRQLPEQLNLNVTANGWDLAGYRLRGGINDVSVDLDNYSRRSHILTRELRYNLEAQLSSRISVNNVYPDTIWLQTEDRMTRKLPVQLNEQVTFAPLYNLGGRITFTPDSVVVTGPATVISRMKEVETETLVRKDVKEEIKTEIELKRPQQRNVRLQQTKVEVTIPVYELSEQEVTIPIEVINQYSDGTIKLIPERITLTYQAPLNLYQTIDPAQFQAVVDGTQVDTVEHQLLKVQLLAQPEYTYNIKLKPEYVDYVIEKLE